jgi:hypothetical protein
MPNYCENTITFVGKKETIQYLKDTELHFDKIRPVPPKNPFGKKGLLVSEQSDLWGTKWDRWDYSVREEEETTLCVNFRTAWGIPYKFLEYLVTRFPDLWLIATFYVEGDAGGSYFLMNRNGLPFWKYQRWSEPGWVKYIVEENMRQEDYEDHLIYLDEKTIDEIETKKKEEEEARKNRNPSGCLFCRAKSKTAKVIPETVVDKKEEPEPEPIDPPMKSNIHYIKKTERDKKRYVKVPKYLVQIGDDTIKWITESEDEWWTHVIYTQEPNWDVVEKYFEYRKKYKQESIYNDVDLLGEKGVNHLPFLTREYYLIEAEHDNITEEENYDWETMVDYLEES